MRSIFKPALLASLLLALPAAQGTELSAFRGSYRTSYNGIPAEASVSLAPAGSGRWNYSLGIQSALGQIQRSAVVDASGERLRPVSNRETVSVVARSRRAKQGSYDWASRQARWSGDVKPERAGPIALQAGDVDGMTLNLAIVQDALAGRPMRYRMVENGKVSQLNFSIAGREAMTVAGRNLQTVRVSSSDGDTTRTLWVAEGIPVPVRILQRDEDTIDLRLQRIN